MSSYLQYSDPNCGFSSSHSWAKDLTNFSRWYVAHTDSFCTSGYAVVDDFGNLVKVAA